MEIRAQSTEKKGNFTFFTKNFADLENIPIFAPANGYKPSANDGAIAQLVEQRTENPCVPGSNPGGTT